MYLWWQIEDIKADPAYIINIGMVNGCNKSHIWWLERISAFQNVKKSGGSFVH